MCAAWVALAVLLPGCDPAAQDQAVMLGGTSVETASGSSSASAPTQGSDEAKSEGDSPAVVEGMARWEIQEEQAGVDPAYAAMNAINAVRQEAGLSPVVQNKLLSKAAQGHATFIADNFELYSEQGLSAYVQPESAPGGSGATPMERMEEAGYQGIYVAELIAFKHSPDAAVQSWLDTLYQRVRILDSNVSEMGHGWSQLEDFTLHIVELGRHE